MRAVRAVFAALTLWVTAGAAMAQGPVVVELFTSQGCSSCPPADQLLGELAGNDDVIALGLHVDYWDYIGWEDTFADRAFTARQHSYAYAAGSTVVYTPQIIVGGSEHVIGNRPMAVMQAIMTRQETPDPVQIDVVAEAGVYVIRAEMIAAPPSGGMVVQLVSYLPQQRVEIRRGENANQTFDYHNIVRNWQIVSDWNGRNDYSARITPDGDHRHVLIIQETGFGPILAAARLN